MSKAQLSQPVHVQLFAPYLWENYGRQQQTVVLPTQEWSRITLRLTLAAPKDSAAGRWDYTMRIWIRHGNDRVELARFITPYGRWFHDPWSNTWSLDVTAFEFLLHGKIGCEVEYEGYSRGSILSLALDGEPGERPVNYYKLDSLWDGTFLYGDKLHPIASLVTPRRLMIDASAKRVVLRVITSGHGFGGTDNAAEFAEKTHHLSVRDESNGRVRTLTQHLWRTDCGANPVSPQAGTWYYERAGWCPGSFVTVYEYDISDDVHPGADATISYNFVPYVNTDTAHPASYIVSAELLYADRYAWERDVGALNIISPSNDPLYWRDNPVCLQSQPEFVMQNLGSDTLRSVRIDYGVDGNRTNRFDWQGSLAFGDTAHIHLPAIELANGEHQFSVLVADPNGKFDDNPENNLISVKYVAPNNFSGPITFAMLVDKVPAEDSVPNGVQYAILDRDGRTLYANDGFSDSAFVRDTFALPAGCYHFVIRDTAIHTGGGDGLFPIYPGSTRGYFVLTDAAGRTIDSASAYNHRANFGPERTLTFNIAGGPEAIPLQTPAIVVKTSGSNVTIDAAKLPHLGSEFLELTVSDMAGRVVDRRRVVQSMLPTIVLEESALPSGRYVARLESMHIRSSALFTIH